MSRVHFTIDRSPYLQGFLSVPYLYLFRLSGTLVAPPATDTGLTFVTRDVIAMPGRHRVAAGDGAEPVAGRCRRDRCCSA